MASLLPHRADLNQEGWTFDAPTGQLRIRHDSGTQLHISGSPVAANLPPDVSLDTPTAGSYQTTSLLLSASASDPDGRIDHVEFRQNGALLASPTSAPYRFTWTQVPAGTYQVTATAVDNVGARTTSTPVSVTVTSPPLGPPPTNLVATLTSGVVNLAWQAPASGSVASYGVYRSTTSGFVPSIGNQVGGVTSR